MNPVSELTNTVTIRNPADVAAIVPYLLGFHPGQSLVVLAIDDARVKGTARMDLMQDSAEMAERARHLADVLTGNGIREALLIGYGPGSQVTPNVDAALDVLRDAGIGVQEAIRIEDGRCWSYICTDVTCCPPEGVPVDPTSSEPAAVAVVAGMRALPDRAALAATLEPPQGFDQDHAQGITRDACARAKKARNEGGGWFWDGVEQIEAALDGIQAGEDLNAETAAWLGVYLTAKPLRDMAMTYVHQYGAETHVRLWTEVTRRVQPAFAAAPATLLAFAALCRGDGPLANIAIERALSVSPHYTLALLLVEALRMGLPPSDVLGRDWSQLAEDVIAQVRECPSAAWPLLPEGW
jgi:hypothetical protein